MHPDNRSKALRHRVVSCLALGAMTINVLTPIIAAEAQALSPLNSRAPRTLTPIKHLIVVIGENRSFDNVFATYVPPDPKQSAWNLLSQGIVARANFARLESGRIPWCLSMSDAAGVDSFWGSERCRSPIPKSFVSA